MDGSQFLLHLAGAVALLIWATRMVRTGVERAFGAKLRDWLRGAVSHPVPAIVAGVGLALAFQSATAVVLLVSGFAGQGLIAVTPGIIAVLGADLGSAVAARLLALDLGALSPVLLLVGTVAFMASPGRIGKQVGRILIGIGLLLLALQLIGEASEPLRDSRLLPAIVSRLSTDPAMAFIVAALSTWLFHSSVAAVLLIAAFAARGVMDAELAVIMILGANFGGALIGTALTRSGAPAARAVVIGNLALRGAFAVVAAFLFAWLSPPLDMLGTQASTQAINAHLVFNAGLVVLGAPLAPLAARFGRFVAAVGAAPADPLASATPASALDEAALANPAQAIANASRELMRLSENVEVMLSRVIELFRHETPGDLEALAALDDRVDSRHSAIKLYLARVMAGDIPKEAALRCQELISAGVRMEQIADIVVRNIALNIAKKRDRGLDFTDEGWAELTAMHADVMANAHLAFNVIVSRDIATAREVVEAKDRMREREKRATERHFERLREGAARSIDTSSIHLETIRDLKEINSLFAALAYPVLEEHGQLYGSRLKR